MTTITTSPAHFTETPRIPFDPEGNLFRSECGCGWIRIHTNRQTLMMVADDHAANGSEQDNCEWSWERAHEQAILDAMRIERAQFAKQFNS